MILKNQRRSFGESGSFYTRLLGEDDRAKMQAINQSVWKTPSLESLLLPVAGVLRKPRAVRELLLNWRSTNSQVTSDYSVVAQRVEHTPTVEIPWQLKNVVMVGASVSPRAPYISSIDDTNLIVRAAPTTIAQITETAHSSVYPRLLLSTEDYDFFASIGVQDPPPGLACGQRFWIPHASTLTPKALASTRGALVAGVDFTTHQGIIEVWEDPRTLFGPAPIVVLEADVTADSPLAFAQAAAGRVREIGNLREWTEALCAELGLPYAGGQVVRRKIAGRVDFDEQSFFAGTSLAVGDTADPLASLDGTLRVRGPDPLNPRWYRQLGWNSGFAPLAHFPDVVVPDANILLGISGVVKGYPYITAVIPEMETEEFWDAVNQYNRAREGVITETFGSGDLVNAVDFFLGDLRISDRLIVVEVNYDVLFPRQIVDLQNFIHRHGWCGYRILVRSIL